MKVPADLNIPGFQLLRLLGEGGMASVYLAVQSSLDRKVAIKVLRADQSDDPERSEQRFLREGRTLAKITHRNVCGIYDLGRVGDLAYIAMEYLDGGTLVDRQVQGIPVAEAIAIVVQLANALQEAHDLGIVHRDLKPANVMMRAQAAEAGSARYAQAAEGGSVYKHAAQAAEGGSVYKHAAQAAEGGNAKPALDGSNNGKRTVMVPVLTDIGIARELTSHQTKITTENMILGTPVYMSPEQVSGGEIDGRSDIYSLGIMFYELLVGTTPYKGDMPIQICMQHLTAPVPQLPLELNELNPVVQKMLAKRREERFASMIEFVFALRQILVSSPNLRVRAELMPDQPWTEQLRALGFSLDTLQNIHVTIPQGVLNAGANAAAAHQVGAASGAILAPVKANVTNSAELLGTTQLPAHNTQQDYRNTDNPALDMPRIAAALLNENASSTNQHTKPANNYKRWWWLLAGLLSLMLLAWGYQHYGKREPSQTEKLALRELARTFASRLNADQLFTPEAESAAAAIREMLEVKKNSKTARARMEKLWARVQEKVKGYLAKLQFKQADALLQQTRSSGFYQEDELQPLFDQLADARINHQRASNLPNLLSAAEAALAGKDMNLDWPSLTRAIDLANSNDDARVQKFKQTLLGNLVLTLDIAIQNSDWLGARKALQTLKLCVPDSALIAHYEDEVGALSSRRSGAERSAALQEQITALSANASSIASVRVELTQLKASGLDVNALEQTFLKRADELISPIAARPERYAETDVLITALGAYAEGESLANIRNKQLQAQQLARAQISLGQVKISSAMAANLVGIYDNDNNALALPAVTKTPLSLNLPAGVYRLEFQDEMGAKTSVAAKLSSEQVLELQLEFRSDTNSDETELEDESE